MYTALLHSEFMLCTHSMHAAVCAQSRSSRVLKGDAEPGDLNLDPFGLTVPLSAEMQAAGDWEGKTPKFKGDRFGPDALPSRVFGLMPSGIRKLKLSEVRQCSAV
jgi:hypothetical protein